MRFILIALALLITMGSVQATLAPTALSAVPPQPLQEPVKTVGCIENPTSLLEIQDCIRSVFGKDYKMALAVAEAESHFNPKAIHYNKDEYGNVWSKDCNVFQVNDYYHKGACEMTVMENIRYAHGLYLSTGWSAWSVYNNGSYIQFLK